MARKPSLALPSALELNEKDVYAAMKAFGAYLDITPGDFKELYTFACAKAQERILTMVTAQSIMTSPPLLLQSGMRVADAIAFLDGHNISGAPVTDAGGRLAGIVSEKDIAHALCAAGNVSAMGLLSALLERDMDSAVLDAPVESVMTRDPVAVEPGTPLKHMLEMMRARAINRLPVLDGARICGIVTRTDMLKVFGFMQ